MNPLKTSDTQVESASTGFRSWLEGQILGSHPLIERVRQTILRAASRLCPVLIYGETGTGKDLSAQAIHRGSARGRKPPVVVVAGALGETAWSILFGHRKGSFTGAMDDRPGLFDLAHDSSLLIEDVSDLPLRLQPMLLRAIEHGLFRALGAGQESRSNARVIASSNRCLLGEIDEGRFRNDLFARLSVMKLEMPPLREHLEDLKIYVPHFLAKVALSPHPPKTLSDGALNVLAEYSWPRNVRELEHVLHRASIETDQDEIGSDTFTALLRHAPTEARRVRPGRTILAIDAVLLRRTLEASRWNKREAARRLGIAPNTLYRLVEWHGIDPPRTWSLERRFGVDSI